MAGEGNNFLKDAVAKIAAGGDKLNVEKPGAEKPAGEQPAAGAKPAAAAAQPGQQAAQPAAGQPAAAQPANQPINWKDIPQEELDAILKERNVSRETITETPEQIKQREAEEETEAIQYGVKKGKTLDELLKYKALEGKTPEEIVKADFRAKLLKSNPKATEEQIEAKFNKQYKPTPIEIAEGADGYEEAKKQYDEEMKEYEAFTKERSDLLLERAKQPLNEIKKDYSEFSKLQKTDLNLIKETKDFLTKANHKGTFDIEGQKIEFEVPEADRQEVYNKVLGNLRLAHAMNLGQKFNIEDNFKEVLAAKYHVEFAKIYSNLTKPGIIKEAMAPFKGAIKPSSPASGQNVVENEESIQKAATSLEQSLKKSLGV